MLLFVHKYTLGYIKNGYYKSILSYFFGECLGEKKALKKYGFSKCKIYKSTLWRFGKGKDRAFRRYYAAYYNGVRTFVKISKNDTTVKNEIKFAEYLKGVLFSFVTPTVLTDSNFNGGFDMLAIEFCEDMKSFSLPENKQEFEALCGQFLAILDGLQSAKVVHADIHKNNLMLKGDELMLIDFGISYSENLENTVNYVARPGTYYKETENGTRFYDDAYSFVKMIEKLSPPATFLQSEQYLKIVERIGSYGFEADLKS
jgi:serine/threonine protein kinase